MAVEESLFSSESDMESPSHKMTSSFLDDHGNVPKVKIPPIFSKDNETNNEFEINQMNEEKETNMNVDDESQQFLLSENPNISTQEVVNNIPKESKRFTCKFCGKSYTQSHSLKTHNKNKHDGNKLCEIEGCNYVRKNQNYIYHLMTNHFNQKFEEEYEKIWNTSEKLECPICHYLPTSVGKQNKCKANLKFHYWRAHVVDKYMMGRKKNKKLQKKNKKLQKAGKNTRFVDQNYQTDKISPKKSARSYKTKEQISILKDYFAQNQHPNDEEIKDLANQIGIKKKQIKCWFKNNRTKQQKTSISDLDIRDKKITEEKISILKIFYAKNPNPNRKERDSLADEIGLEKKEIKKWFLKQKPKKKNEKSGQNNQKNNQNVKQVHQDKVLKNKCESCDKDFSDDDGTLKLHENCPKGDDHQNENPNPIQESKKGEEDGKFECAKCNKKFSNFFSARAHAARKHVQLFQCQKCENYKGNKSQLKSHLELSHELKGNKNLISKYGLKLNNSEIVPPATEDFDSKQCKYCGKDFGKCKAWKHFLQKHQNSCKSNAVGDPMTKSVKSGKIESSNLPENQKSKKLVKSQKIELPNNTTICGVWKKSKTSEDLTNEAIENETNSKVSTFEAPKQKWRPKPKSKSNQFLSKEENCDKCKNQLRYSTINYDGRLCLVCLDKWVKDTFEVTDNKIDLFRCDFCDEKNIPPEIYIHMDKVHYEDIVQSEEIIEKNDDLMTKNDDDDKSLIQSQILLPNDENNISQSEQIEKKDLQITFVKKEHSLLSKTKVQLTINRDNEETEVFRILIRKPPNSVTLADVKQHLMSNPKKYNNFNGDLFEYNVKTNIDGIDGFEDCDEEEDEVATLPLIENQIVLKCWYKS